MKKPSTYVSVILIALFFLPMTTHAAVFFSDSFESGNKNYVGPTGAKWTSSVSTSVTSEKSRTGKYSLKFLFKGNSSLTADANSEQRFYLGSNKNEVYVRYYVYFPSNYTIRAASGPTNTKLFRLWGNDYTNRNKVGMSIGRGLGAYFEAVVEGSPRELSCNGGMGKVPDGGGFTLGSEHLGKWTSFEYHFKKDSGSGDGIMRMYVNGQLKIDLRNQSWAGSPCSPGYFLNGYLMGWSNSGFNQDTVVYIDDVVFSDSYIGTGGNTTPPPPTPPNLDPTPSDPTPGIDNTPPAVPTGLRVQ